VVIIHVPSGIRNREIPVFEWSKTVLDLVNGWSKSHATHTTIFIYGCSSVQFDWINKHTISLWLYNSSRRSRHVVTCSRQSVSCLQTVDVQGCLFSHVQRVFIVDHYLASRSCVTCQNEFRDNVPILLCQTIRQYLVWWTVSVTQELFTGLHQTWGREWVYASLNEVDISDTQYNIAFFVFWFHCNLFFDK
jgi:hypothetical protein